MSVNRSLVKRLRKVMCTKPRRYQMEGIGLIEQMNGRCLLGDDMGLGKTIQVIGYLALHPESRPAVIVCPASAKFEWEDQIDQHTRRMTCQVLEGRTPYEFHDDILIVNFEILPYWEKSLLKLKPMALIIDEVHNIKTRKIKRTQSCRKLAKTASVFIPMSGTPIVNRPIEFFPVLQMLHPRKFSSFWRFAFQYCNPKPGWKGKGWDFSGAANTDELHRNVSPFMIRRMKSEVLTELPPKQRILIPVHLANQAEYEKARDHFLDWYETEYGKERLKKAKRASAFVQLGQLRRLTGIGKLATAIKWIDDFLETTDQKLVVFCYHKIIFNGLTENYQGKAALGGKSGRKRKEQVKIFQSDPSIRLFIGSIKADKEAITLTAASTVLFVEQGWTPGEHDQAEDRVNRIGQTADSISAYYLLGRNSIDEYLHDLIERKRRILAQVLDGEEVAESERKMASLNQLIRDIHSQRKPK